MTKNATTLINNARLWLNTPWKHNGSTKGLEVDCVNFLLCVGRETGIDLPDIPRQYGRYAKDDDIRNYLKDNLIKKDNFTIEPANVLLYKLSGYNTHVAIATSCTTIIHACNYRRYNKVIEHPIDGIWFNRIESIWEINFK